jgi:outer membrane receptor protein involved in Fe transport
LKGLDREKRNMKYSWLLLLLIYVSPCLAQDNGNDLAVSGAISDEQNNAIPYASVALYNQQDSSMVGGAVSDEAGKFHIGVKPGNYYLRISFLSFEEKIIPVGHVSAQGVDLGMITLRSAARTLKEVVVTGEKSQMELQLDKRVFNVGKDLSNIGGSAADILGNLPSVNVDPDGVVSLRGSENVRILIDGRPSGLTSRDPDALRKLQGNLVERVEIITNPSSRYDAAGEVGIINIIMKKNQQKGINGAITANAGHPDFYGGSYTLNVRRKNVNLFSNYGVDYRRRPGRGHSFQQFTGTDSSYRQNNERIGSETSHNLMLGLDYFLTDKSTLTGSFLYNTGDGITRATTTYRDFKNDEPAGTVIRTEREHEDEKNIEGSLNFKQDLKRKGEVFTADFKWIKSVDNETTDYTEGPEGETPRLQYADNLANEVNWLFQTDYIRPFSKEGKFETGLKTATRVIRNEFGLQELDKDGSWIVFPTFTNNLVYTERVHAAYLMGSNRFNKLSLQGGLRFEYSDIKTELTQTHEINPRQYFNFFPSASVSYAIRENKTLQFSYSYRISRPEFRDLMPFSDFRDSRVFFVGNPKLRPEYTHSIEAGYLLDWKNGSILSSIYHRHRSNVIQRIVTTPEDNDSTRIIVPINMAQQNAYGLEFNISLNVQNWWRINSSANFYRAITDGVYEGDQLYSDTYTWTTRTTSRMTFFKALNFQASFNYRAPRITPQGKQLSVHSLDLALSRDVLKGKGTVTANVSDLFNTRKRRSIVDTGDYFSESVFQGRVRQFMLTFTYRINREKERNEGRERDRDDEGAGEY